MMTTKIHVQFLFVIRNVNMDIAQIQTFVHVMLDGKKIFLALKFKLIFGVLLQGRTSMQQMHQIRRMSSWRLQNSLRM